MYRSAGLMVVMLCMIAGTAWAQTPRQTGAVVAAPDAAPVVRATAPPVTSRPAVPNMQETGFWRVSAGQPASGELKLSAPPTVQVSQTNPSYHIINRGAHTTPQTTYLQLDLNAKQGRQYHLKCYSLLFNSTSQPQASVGKLAGARFEGGASVQSGLITANQAGAGSSPATHTGVYTHERPSGPAQLRLTRVQTNAIVDSHFQAITACEVRELTPDALMR